MSKKIASISISGEITLNLHSLNNEGGEGNQILTRQLTIVDKNGKEHTVNGISGDMFKHIHAEHLVNYSKDKKLDLCKNCSIFNPNRLSSGEDLGEHLKGNEKYTDKDIADAIIEKCTIDDLHGVLITKIGSKNKNHARKSTIEFGWTIGIPEKTNTETYIHTKLVKDAEGRRGDGSNDGQNIFHRPANHGVYAFVCNLDIYRIGFNDVDRTYKISDEKRKARYNGVLQSLLHSFLNPKGAMTSTQKPHITDFKGVVAISTGLTPAPTISPLNPDYLSEITKISKNLNIIENNIIELKEFEGLGQLSEVFVELIKSEPYKIS